MPTRQVAFWRTSSLCFSQQRFLFTVWCGLSDEPWRLRGEKACTHGYSAYFFLTIKLKNWTTVFESPDPSDFLSGIFSDIYCDLLSDIWPHVYSDIQFYLALYLASILTSSYLANTMGLSASEFTIEKIRSPLLCYKIIWLLNSESEPNFCSGLVCWNLAGDRVSRYACGDWQFQHVRLYGECCTTDLSDRAWQFGCHWKIWSCFLRSKTRRF